MLEVDDENKMIKKTISGVHGCKLSVHPTLENIFL